MMATYTSKHGGVDEDCLHSVRAPISIHQLPALLAYCTREGRWIDSLDEPQCLPGPVDTYSRLLIEQLLARHHGVVHSGSGVERAISGGGGGGRSGGGGVGRGDAGGRAGRAAFAALATPRRLGAGALGHQRPPLVVAGAASSASAGEGTGSNMSGPGGVQPELQKQGLNTEKVLRKWHDAIPVDNRGGGSGSTHAKKPRRDGARFFAVDTDRWHNDRNAGAQFESCGGARATCVKAEASRQPWWPFGDCGAKRRQLAWCEGGECHPLVRSSKAGLRLCDSSGGDCRNLTVPQLRAAAAHGLLR